MAQQIDIVANLLMKVDGAEAGINKLKSSLSKLKMPEGLENSFKKSFSNLDTIFAKYRSQVEKGFNTKGDVSAFSKTSKELDVELNRISRHFTELTGKQIDFKVKSDSVVKAEKDLQNLITQKEKLGKDTLQFKIDGGKGKSDIASLLTTFKEIAGISTNAGKAANNVLGGLGRGDITSTLNAAKQLEQAYQRLGNKKKDLFSSTTGLDMGTVVTALITQLTGVENKFKVVDGEIKIATQDLARFKAEQIGDAASQVEKLSNSFEQNKSAINQANGAMQDYARSSQSMSQQLGDLQQSTQYFFSLRNMINLFRRGVQDAIQSVKELDKAMTDTAVVTDYSVSDMWGMLPQYTKIANELGATTQGAYETMTLYFQQGLDQQQAFELGAETMKMARIAGLDYAKTTDMMTAALRGFNMELNETSAKRINDVYSELAARTASDTQEIGEAMERTASIAHSAGMSFEGTSAFLAQMIETTREAPENLGTAMKTIIARFQELKKNPLEMQEVDGEEVSFNKVDAALQTIGVSLKDTNGQFRELDKVFLDIAQRWDGLTQTQQRYIATTAAGSRQQSRFIAMMSNYSRTAELMGYANDSAGASQKQFEKTMDSLESKLNQLHNAWQQFTMGIANNGMIKGAVDGITGFLGTINNLIDTLSLGSGTLKSFLSLFMAFTGLKAAGKIINGLVGGLGGLLDPQSSFGKGFFGGGFLGNRNANIQAQASAIYSPIVAELRALRGQQQSLWTKQSGPYEQYNAFRQGRQDLRELTKGQQRYNVQDVIGKLNKLTPANQMALMKTMPGTSRALRTSLMNQYGNLGLNQKQLKEIQTIEKSMRNDVQRGKAPLAEYYKAMTDPNKLLAQIPKEGSSAARSILTRLSSEVNAEADKILANKVLDDFKKGSNYKSLDTKEGRKAYQQALRMAQKDTSQVEAARAQALRNQGYGSTQNTKKDNAFDAANKFAAGIQGVGMAITSFGTLLSNSANPAVQSFGNAMSSLGGVVTNIGMAFSSLALATEAVTSSKLMEAAASKLGIGAGQLTAGLGILVAAIAGTALAIKAHRDNIRKEAEKITSDYKDRNEKAQTNINNLKSWQADFARLSAGVDQNGYNVNLDQSDYDRYLEIARGLAEINPEIVDGYNAQGQAIINNNKALEDTLKLEEQHQQEAFRDYTSPEAMDALKSARDLARQRVLIQDTLDPKIYNQGEGYEFAPQAEMRKNAQRIGTLLNAGIKQGWASEDLLKDFNINISKLAEGDEATLQKFDQLGPKIQQRINNTMESAGDKIKDSTKESMLNAFTGYSEASDELDELINPMYEQLMTKMGTKSAQIPEEFRTYFNQGLKAIVSDANVKDVNAEANKLADHFSVLTSEGSDYYKVMDKVAEAQDNYAATLNKTEYDKAANDAVNSLQSIRDELGKNVDLSSGYGQAISEFLDNEINKIRDFTEEGAANLSQALNTMTDEIAAAEGALENFNSVAEGSNYSTASSNLAKIYEEAISDVHTAGLGDQTFWTGAEALVGREDLKGKTKAEAQEMMSSVNEMLKGGQEGWDNFKIRWFDSVEAMGGKLVDTNGEIIEGITYDENGWFKTLDENINPQVYEQVAEALDMSKDSLIAMLNLGRQFGEVDFSNIDEARKALSTSDAVIAGNSTDKNGNRSLWIKENTLYSELAQAGITDINAQEEKVAELAERNVNVISKAGEMTIDQFQDMGIKSMDSLIDIFDSTGQFTKDEMAEYAEQWAELNNLDSSEFNEKFNEHLNELENGEAVKQTNELSDLNSTTSSIESILASMRIEEGHLDNPQADQLKQDILGGKSADTIAQLFSLGKNEKGQELTKTEYDATRKELVASQQSITNYLKTLQDNRDKAQGEERDKFDTEIANVSKYLDFLNKYIENGDAAWKQKEQERAQAEAEKNAIKNQAEAENEKYRQRAENSNQVESGDFSQAQQQLQTMMNNGFTNLFSSIDPQQMMTPEVASAIGTLYSSYLTQGAQQATPQIQQALSTLGISLEDAIKAGLIIDESGLTGAVESDYDKTAKGVQNTLKNATDVAIAVSDSASSAASETSSSLSSLSGKIAKSVEGFASDINNITLPALKTPEISTPVTKGIEAVSNIATEAVAATLTVDNNEANSKLEETQQIAQQAADVVSKGATFTINTPGLQNLVKASGAAKKLNAAQGNTSFNVSANVSGTSNIQSFNAAAKTASGLSSKTVNYTAVVSGTSSVWSAVSAGNSFENLRDHTVTYTTVHKTINDNGPMTGGYITSAGVLYRAKGGIAEHPGYPKKGTDRIPAYLTPGEYVQNRKAVQYFGIDFMRRINHKDLIGALQSFGSVAKGRYGRLGPNGKGGLTLTGEEGFEVGWIPSENRSVILGAKGPQMVDLPSDTIIWDHKQSKKIVSQNAIPAGSHYVTSKGATDPRKTTTTTSGRTTTQVTSTVRETADNVEKAVEKTTKKIVKVSVWWENIARKTEYSQRQMDKSQKAFEKYTKDLRATLRKTGISTSQGGGGGDTYIKRMGNYIGYNQAQLAKAEKELKGLDTWKKGVENQDKRKNKYGNQGYENIVQISWTDDSKESHEAFADLAGYIKIENGTYVVDQAQLNKIKDINQRKATAEAANKEIDDRLSKKYKAEDNITKAREALEQMSEELYKTFFGWSTSLTKIWNITQKIERLTQKIDRTDSYNSILEAQIGSGLREANNRTAKEELKNFRKRLSQQNSVLIQRQNAIKQAIKDVNNAVSTSDEKAELATINQKLKSNSLTQTERLGYEQAKTELTKKIAVIEKAQDYLTIRRNSDGTLNISFNTDNLQRDRINGLITEDMAKGIEDYVKNLKESSDNLDELYKTLNNDISNYYNNLIELQDQWADYEEQLIQIEEETQKKEIDKVRKIYDSVKEALDKLLNEVKNKLEERRKQEDNQKTEQEISQKQQRLSMLRADTSGGHAVEIAQLEKEITDAQQNYQRSLEDQLLEKLQNQADEAHKQREEQIQLQEELVNSVNNIEQVNQWMANPTQFKNELKQAYRNSNNYEEKGNAGQAKIDRDFEVLYEGLITNQNKQVELTSAIQENTAILEALTEAIKSQNNHNLTAKEAKRQGATLREMKNSYSPTELKEAGWKASDFYKAGISANKAYEAGFKPKELHDAGYSLSQFKSATKLGVKEAYKAGYTDPKALAKEYGVLNTMQNLKASGKTIQSVLGANNNATIAKVQEWINAKDENGKKKYTNLTQTDLAGMKADLTIDGKKITGSVTAGGKYVYANVGSTLYGQALDSKGKLTGKLSTTSIQNLTPAYFKSNKKEATEALVYAIQHQNPGTLINKNFLALAKAAGIVGKEYQIDTGSYKVMATVGGDGNIFYNVADGVRVWNPAKKGVNWLDKYNLARFKKMAKTTAGREYAQVLRAKGVKGYATGGLADYTGPAWLDGTPAKPELVLNAQDTKNFIALKDVLSKAIGSTSSVSNEYGGDATYEININVDHLNSDYDVDKVAERVKKIIVKDSSYRNVTQVRKFR